MLLYVLLAVIAAILFYKFVERKHKVLIAKVVVGLAALAGLAVVVMWSLENQAIARERMAEKQRLASVIVLFVRPGKDAHHWGKSTDTVGGALFQLCNHGTRRVTSVAFVATTYEAERSTPHELQVMAPWEIPGAARMPWDTASPFHSDFILDPNKCVSLTWPGWYQVFDSVSVAVTDVAN
jgi:hypothetical protein